MDRNTETAYAELDTIETPRSMWQRSKTHKTSFNAGYLIPFYANMDIIPGTTIKNKTSMIIRMSTPLDPVMDNMYCDTYWFKCSKFWYWEHFRAMLGENELGAWTQEVEYTEPKIKTNASRPTTVNDMSTYLGVRPGVANLEYSKIIVSAIIDIWNNWFRDQNLQAPIQIDKTDADLNVDGTINTGCGLLPVQKFHDYFTSALPEPQKGNAISTPLGTTAPVKIYGNNMTLGLIGPHTAKNPEGYYGLIQSTNDNLYMDKNAYNKAVGIALTTAGGTGLNNAGIGLSDDPTKSGVVGMADLTQATAATINALRLAFATQRILEKDARFGTRYREILKGHFGVTASDESLLVPEYLGGTRTPINIETVLQNSATNETSPLGETGAVSVTAITNEDFTKSFTKDDMLIGVLCVRADHTYQQGLPRQYTRTRRLDRYWPALAHIGNQPIYNYEIFAQGNEQDNEVFGYKEAWQEYLYEYNMISGELLSEAPQSLDVWHYGDDYSTLPVLSDEWICEPREFIDRTLAVNSSKHHQFIADIVVEQTVAAPIPLNRVPGMIDHF
jgi:hypothetical protein